MSKRTSPSTHLIVTVCLLSIAGVTDAKNIYVDADATGANDGTSWENAFLYLQDALMFAVAGDEIRVAEGVYRPDDFVLSDRPNLGRDETFQLINGVTLKGGYAGLGQPDPNARDIELSETILSGDLDSNDVNGLDDPSRDKNSYHVVTGDTLGPNAVLDGFTITGGNADDVYPNPNYSGGGMSNSYGSPTLINCTFRANYAWFAGGGMSNSYGSPVIENCTFCENSSVSGHGNGGGMCNRYGTPVLIGCLFSGNSSDRGGGMFNDSWYDGDSPTLVDCTFRANYASWDGGGMSHNYDSPTLINCIFSGNWVGGKSLGYGGGAISGNGTCSRLVNCTFSGNSAGTTGGAILLSYSDEAPATLANCIFWGNDADEGPQITLYWSTLSVSYCDIQGGQAGIALIGSPEVEWLAGNIEADPCFADPGYWDANGTPQDGNDDFWVDADYHLKSQGGRWDPNSQSWVIDDVTSPCIDAGDPMSPIGPEPFPNGGIINMGAYGGTVEASKSYFDKPLCDTIIAGDINGDCEVNFLDFRLMALHWMEGHD